MTDRLVVDASVVAKFYLKDEDHSQIAQQLLGDFSAGSIDLVAPQFLLHEVASTLLGAVRRRRLDQADADEALEELLTLGVQFVQDNAPGSSMLREAYALASRFGCGLYDALYLSVSLTLDLPLITADGRLYRGMAEKVPQLVWIADYQINRGAST
jgi:predicted nucleic acid-binding protein